MKNYGWLSSLRRLHVLLTGLSRNPSRRRRVLLQIEYLEERIALDDNSAGPNGINARALGLTGQGVHIGQVEGRRPGLKGFDDKSHPDVTPAAVFLRDDAAVANADVFSDHATGVAGVMIANGAANQGVARNASLHSSAFRSGGSSTPAFQDALLSMQKVAMENNDDVPAVNMSFGKRTLKLLDPLDGSSLLSMGLDYLAQSHDTLFVMARANKKIPVDLPQDSYNGLVVGSAEQKGKVYRQVSDGQSVSSGDPNNRRLIDLIAPGEKVSVPELPDIYKAEGGSSVAAPHATATVALLVQDARARGLPDAAAFSEVQKAILINSAEKVEGRIGMGRTVFKQNGKDTWDNSDARDDPGNPGGRTLPLDDQMGFGFLNASRADTQLRGGLFAPNAAAGPIGWDYRSIADQGTINKYILPRLKGGSWISITLTWNRQVDLNDKNSNGLYDVGDTFKNPQLSNLDLYLMPAGANNINQNIWSSVSTDYNLETIFFHLPADSAGYEIWVRQANNINANYGLAWWSESAPPAKPDKIGDKVWSDTNGNGIQDTGEPGIENVGVQLYSSDGTLVDSTTTDYYGNYSFEVDPGTYYVQFTAPYGMGFTTQYAGTDPTLDSNADASGRTGLFTIGSSSDSTIDAGLTSLPYGSGAVSQRCSLRCFLAPLLA